MPLTPIDIVTSITALLLVGVLVSLISTKLRLPEILLLILTGMGIGYVPFEGMQLISFPPLFLTSMAIVALAMIIFDSSMRIKLRELDRFSIAALKLTGYSVLFVMVIFSIVSWLFLGLDPAFAVLFAALVSGSSAEVLLSSLPRNDPLMNILKLESIFNTPLTVLLPFFVLDLLFVSNEGSLTDQLIASFAPFLTKIVAGIGAGIFVGVVLFKILQRKYNELYTPLAVILSALLAYVLAEKLGGDGVLSVTALGLFFGNAVLRERMELVQIESVFTKGLYVFVFVLVGLIIKLPLTSEFFIASLTLFGIYLLIRFFAVSVALRKESYTFLERLFVTLNTAKGIATATVVFTLAISLSASQQSFEIVLNMVFAFMLYSIFLSSMASKCSPWFLRKQAPAEQKKKQKNA